MSSNKNFQVVTINQFNKKKNDLKKDEANIIDFILKVEAEMFSRDIINYAHVLVLIVSIHKFVTA